MSVLSIVVVILRFTILHITAYFSLSPRIFCYHTICIVHSHRHNECKNGRHKHEWWAKRTHCASFSCICVPGRWCRLESCDRLFGKLYTCDAHTIEPEHNTCMNRQGRTDSQNSIVNKPNSEFPDAVNGSHRITFLYFSEVARRSVFILYFCFFRCIFSKHTTHTHIPFSQS